MKKHLSAKALISLFLAIIISIFPLTASAGADDPYFITVPVLFSGSSKASDQSFLVTKDGKTYVSESFILDKFDTSFHRDANGQRKYKSDRGSLLLDQNDYLSVDGKVYLPMESTFNAFSLSSSYYEHEDTKVLTVTLADNLSFLPDLMNSIYKDPAVNLSNWQNSKYFLTDRTSMFVLDALKNSVFSLAGYATGQAQMSQYQDALYSILTSATSVTSYDLEKDQAELDLLNYLITEAGLTYDAAKALLDPKLHPDFTDLIPTLDLGETVISETSKAVDLLQLAEFRELIAFLNARSEMNDSLIQAISLINSGLDDNNSPIKLALGLTLGNYDDAVSETTKIAGTFLTGFANDLASGDVLDQEDYLLKALEFITDGYDMIMGKTDEISSVIQAMRQLEIQKLCRAEYETIRRYYNKAADPAAKSNYLKQMHSLTSLYVAAGIEAYKALGADSEMKGAFAQSISDLDLLLSDLNKFNISDFKTAQKNSASADRIAGAAKKQPSNSPAPAPTPDTPKVQGSIVHDWIMRDGRIRFFLYEDGTFSYSNDNNHHSHTGTYTYDGHTVSAFIDGEQYTGYMRYDERSGTDELYMESPSGFFIFEREAVSEETDPVIIVSGDWSTEDGSKAIFFGGDQYTYVDSSAGISVTSTYEADIYNEGNAIFFFDLIEGEDPVGGFFYEADKTLRLFDTNDIFIPASESDFPFVD